MSNYGVRWYDPQPGRFVGSEVVKTSMDNKEAAGEMWHYRAEESQLVFAIASYNLPSASTVMSQLQSVFEELFVPFIDKGEGITFTAGFCKAGTSHWRFFQPNNINWRQLTDEFPTSLTVLLDSKQKSVSRVIPEVAKLVANIRERPKEAHTVEGSISLNELFNGRVNIDFQAKLVRQTKQLYLVLNGVNGFIAISPDMAANSAGLETPYEYALSLPYYHVATTFREKLRGYFWGNFLSRQHVDLLGGDSALRAAPVELVEEIATGGYYLQLSKDLHAVDHAQLEKLGAFLRPVLPQKKRLIVR